MCEYEVFYESGKVAFFAVVFSESFFCLLAEFDSYLGRNYSSLSDFISIFLQVFPSSQKT